MCEITKTSENKLTITYAGADGSEKVKTVTLTDTNGTQIGTKWQYTATDDTSKITYTFVTTDQLTDGTPTTGTVTIDYGHIFAEGFGGWRTYKKHVNQSDTDFTCNTVDENQSDNLVHAWLWHFFVILIVVKILLTATLLIPK